MSVIFGIISKTGELVDPYALETMGQSLRPYPYDKKLILQNDHIAAGKLLRFNTPESKHSIQPQSTTTPHTYIIFDGRIDNREELANALGLKGTTLDTLPDEDLIIKAYEKWKDHCCDRILGDFAFVIISGNDVLISRDHVGARPLFIAENNEYLAFSSNKKALLALPWVSRSENHQWIADLLCLVKVDKHTTYYQDISSFLPAYFRSFTIDSHNKKDTYRQYWSLNADHTIELASDKAYAETFYELLNAAIKCRTRSAYPIATELSGGLDSTTVTGVANQIINHNGGHPLITCSHIFTPELRGKVFPYKDEHPQIKEFSDLHNIQIRKSITSYNKGSIENLEKNVLRHGSPSRSDLTTYSEALFDAIKPYDARVLLSGYGGDQVVSSFAHGLHEELAINGQFSTLWRELRINRTLAQSSCHWLLWRAKSTLPFTGHAIHYYQRRKQPMLFNWQSLLQKLFVNSDYAQSYGYPDRHFEHPPWLTRGSVRERELYLFNRATLYHRIEDSAVGAEFYGVEYRYPLLDKRLLEFCLAIPTRQKYRNGVNRRMIKTNGEKLLPQSIREKNTKAGCGSTIPNANYRRVKDKSKFITALHDMKLTLGEIPHTQWDKLIHYANQLTSDPDRRKSEIPKAFDKSYQLLFTQTSTRKP